MSDGPEVMVEYYRDKDKQAIVEQVARYAYTNYARSGIAQCVINERANDILTAAGHFELVAERDAALRELERLARENGRLEANAEVIIPWSKPKNIYLDDLEKGPWPQFETIELVALRKVAEAARNVANIEGDTLTEAYFFSQLQKALADLDALDRGGE